MSRPFYIIFSQLPLSRRRDRVGGKILLTKFKESAV
jgi:hypothetical protein